MLASFSHTANIAFQNGTAAQSADSTFLYDPATGVLRYDPDGNGAAAAVGLAQLNTGLTLSISDFGFL